MIVMVFGGGSSDRQTLVDSVVKGCDKELKTFCTDVTPGEGVSLPVCIRSGKLSDRCDNALYDAAA